MEGWKQQLARINDFLKGKLVSYGNHTFSLEKQNKTKQKSCSILLPLPHHQSLLTPWCMSSLISACVYLCVSTYIHIHTSTYVHISTFLSFICTHICFYKNGIIQYTLSILGQVTKPRGALVYLSVKWS